MDILRGICLTVGVTLGMLFPSHPALSLGGLVVFLALLFVFLFVKNYREAKGTYSGRHRR